MSAANTISQMSKPMEKFQFSSAKFINPASATTLPQRMALVPLS